MPSSDKATRQVKEVRNPQVQLSEADAAAFKRLRERRFAQMDKADALARAARPTEEMRLLKAETDAFWTKAVPDYAAHKKAIVSKFGPQFLKLSPETLKLEYIDLDFDYHGDFEPINPPPPPPPPAGVGELWWAQTSWFWNLGGLNVDMPDDWVHIWGHVHYGGDPLLTGSVGAIEEFVLTPNRFPATAKTSFDINTELRIQGVLSGWTGMYHPIWHADDKWCKCWQVLRRTALLSTGATLDNKVNPFNYIDLANVNPVGQANPSMYGGYGELLHFDLFLPALVATGTSILVQIETRYDIQLEGDADIWFRRNGGTAAQSVPSLQNSLRFRSNPMFLQPK